MAIITKNTGLRPGIRPAINLDFAGSESSFENRLRFTRTSRATRYNKNGLIEAVNQGSPRVDFNPATKACKGLLIEEARTNNVDSYNFSNVNTWYKRNAGIAPDGTYSATLLSSVRTPTSVTCGIWSPASGSITAGQTYTCSVYVKAGPNPDSSYIRMMNSGTNVDYNSITINWSSGVPSLTGGSPAGTSTHVGNGWYRITITGTISAGQSSLCMLYYVSTGGNGTKDVYIWGVQFELGQTASSYIYPSVGFSGRTTAGSYNDRDGLVKVAGRGQRRINYQPIYDEIHTGLETGGSNAVVLYNLPGGDAGNLRLAGPLYEGVNSGEGTVTNLCSISTNITSANVGFSGTSLNITNETTAPDGSYNASKFVFGSSNDRLDNQWGAFQNNTWYTLSIWVKGVAGTTVGISLLAQGGGNVEPYFTLNGSWQRLSVRRYFTDATDTGNIRTHGVIIRGNVGAPSGATVNGGNGNWASYVYVWGMQVEIGQAPTSFIPAFGATASRTADSISQAATSRSNEFAYIPYGKRNNYTLSSHTSNLTSSDEVQVPYDDFTVYAEWNSYSYTNDFPRIFHSTNASSVEGSFLVAIYPGASPANDVYIQQNNTPNTQAFAGAGQSINTDNKIAAAYDRAGQVFRVNANGGTTVASGTIPATTPVRMGDLYIASSNSTIRHLNGWIKKVSVYNEPLSSNELKELTR